MTIATPNGPGAQGGDLGVHLRDGVANVGEVTVYVEEAVPHVIGLGLMSGPLLYHNVADKVFSHYEEGSFIGAEETRFYNLLWKEMRQTYLKHHYRRQFAFEDMTNLAFIEDARTWSEEQLGPRLHVTKSTVRTARAILEHFAIEQVRARNCLENDMLG